MSEYHGCLAYLFSLFGDSKSNIFIHILVTSLFHFLVSYEILNNNSTTYQWRNMEIFRYIENIGHIDLQGDNS